MAISKDQEFKIKIVVEDQASSQFESLEGKSVDMVDVSEAMQKQLAQVVKALQSVKNEVPQATRAYQQAAGATQNYSKQVKQANVQTAAITQTATQGTAAFSSFAGAVSATTDGITGIVTSVASTISAVRDFIELIMQLSNPDNLKRLSKILYVLSVVAKLKGFGNVSDQLRGAATSVGDLSVEVTRLGSMFNDELESMTTKAKIFYAVMDTIEVSAKAAMLALVTFTASGVIGGLTALAKNAGLIDKSLLELTKHMGKYADGIMASVMNVNTYLDNLLKVNVSKVAKALALKFGSVFAGSLSTALSGSFAVGFKTISATMAALSSQIGRASTVGAQQIGLLKIAFLDFSAAISIVTHRIGLFADATSGISKQILFIGKAISAQANSVINGAISTKHANKIVALSVDTLRLRFNDLSTAISSVFGKKAFSFSVLPIIKEAISELSKASIAFLNIGKIVAESFFGGLRIGFKGDKAFNTVKQQIDNLNKVKFDQANEQLQRLQSALSGLGKIAREVYTSIAAPFSNLFGSASTVGAKQIGILQVAAIDLGAAFDIVKSKTVSAASTMFTAISTGVSSATKNFGVFAKGFKDGFIAPITAGANAAKTLDAATLGAAANAARIAGTKASFKGLTAATVGFTEAGTFIAPLLATIGVSMASADSAFVKFLGTVSIVAATILGGFAAVVTFTLNKIGKLAEAIGDTLIGSMEKWEQKAAKMQSVTAQFEFTMRGFGQTMGVEVVGSVEQANEAIDNMAQNSTISLNELRKSFNLLTTEGASLGLTFTDKVKLMNTALDAAASTGVDYKDMVGKINSALLGQAQGLATVGINLQESGLAHSKYLKEIGKEYNTLTEHEKVQVRLYELYHQTTPMIGAAAIAMDTIEGATARYNNTLELLQAQLGAQSTFTVAYLNILKDLATFFMNLPPAVVNATGALIDFAGVVLKVGGVVLANVAIVMSLMTIWGILLGLVQSNAIAQNVLTVAMAALGGVVNVQTVQVTGLATAWANLQAIMMGSVRVVLVSIGNLLLMVTKRVIALTASLLMNPIVLTAAAIVAGVILLYEAFKELGQEIDFLGDAFDSLANIFKSTGKSTSMLDEAWEGTKKIVSGLWRILINFTKFIVAGLLSSVLFLAKGWAKLSLMWKTSQEDISATEMYMAEIDDRIRTLGKSVGMSMAGMATAFESSAIAAEAAGDKYAKAASFIEKFRLENAALSATLDKDSITVGVWGDKYAKASQKINELSVTAGNAMSEFRNLKATGSATADQLKTAWDKSASATSALAIAYEELKKIRKDAFVDMQQQTKLMQVTQLKDEGKLAQAAQLEADMKLEAFDKEIAALEKTYKLRKDELDIIQKQRKAIQEAGKASVDAGKEEEIKKAQEAAGKGGVLFDSSQLQIITNNLGEATGAFASGMSSATAGFLGVMSAMSMIVNALQSLIDIIPQFIDSVTKLFTSLTDLPKVISEAISNLIKGIEGFISDFLPNLIDAIGDIVGNLLTFLTDGLTKAFESLAVKLPAAFLKLIERLPELAVKFGMALVNVLTLGAKFAVIFIKGMAKAAPVLIAALIKAIPEIVMGLVDGIIFAGKELVNMLSNLFGMGDVFNIDIGDVEQQVTDMGDNIAKSASKLFEVIDLTAAMRGMDMADRIQDSIKSAMWDVLAWLKGLWDKMIKWLSMVGQWIWDGLKEAISKAWEWIKTMGAAVWEGLKAAIALAWEFIKSMGAKIWERLKELMAGAFEFLKSLGSKIWDGLKASLSGAFDFFKDLGKKIWDGLWSKLKEIGSFFQDIFDGLNPSNFFEKMFGKIDYKGKGTVEKALGIDVPYANFAEGGIVGGQAVVRGDNVLNDKILALVSAGEAIIPRSKMEDPNTQRLVGQILEGNVPQYSMASEFVKSVSGGSGISLPSLGDLTKNISIGNFEKGMQSSWDGLKNDSKSAWMDAYSKGKQAMAALKYLNPEYLWKQVYAHVMSGLWKMIENNKFQEGGYVADMGLAEKGEFVLKRSAVQGIGVGTLNEMNNGTFTGTGSGSVTIQKIEINARTNLDADSIRREVFPEIVKSLKRASQDGQFILSQRGVRA